MVVISETHGPYVPEDKHPEGDHCIHPLPMEPKWVQCCHCGKSDTAEAFGLAGPEPVEVAPEPVVEAAGGIVAPAEDAP